MPETCRVTQETHVAWELGTCRVGIGHELNPIQERPVAWAWVEQRWGGKDPHSANIGKRFLLTDELFSLSGDRRAYNNIFRLYYALGAGGSFYLAWNAWTAIGIIAGTWLPDLTHLGLDFAIAATFIALVIPDIKTLPILVCVLVSASLSVIFSIYSIKLGLVSAALIGMLSGFAIQKLRAAQ